MEFENKFIGLTVKEVLINELGFSRKAITALKTREDGILINGEHVSVRAVIRAGDILSVNYDDRSEAERAPVPSPAPSIIYEDDYIVALNKPPYMPTHQSHGHFDDTLANSIEYHYATLGRPFVFRAVNRLDRNTSGTVLVAKDRITASRLAAQMEARSIKKRYIAILDGTLPSGEGVISTHIRRREKSIITRCVCREDEDGAKPAITRYALLGTCGGLSLVLAEPETGRTHQLRVHFSHIGAPILGDSLYGRESELIGRHALHAAELSFTHPQTLLPMTLSAPLPEDMKQIIDKYFKEDFAKYEQG